MPCRSLKLALTFGVIHPLRMLVLAMLPFNSVLAADWKLVWSDEFDYHGLPNSKKWDYEEGYVRNEERQFYTRARLENARVEKGMLVIEARKEQFKIPQFDPKSNNSQRRREFADYTAASLITLGKAAWKYGR